MYTHHMNMHLLTLADNKQYAGRKVRRYAYIHRIIKLNNCNIVAITECPVKEKKIVIKN